MYQNDSYRKPISPERFPCAHRPMENLRRCSCGRMTFLSLPCAECGSVSGSKVKEQRGISGFRFHTAILAFVLGGGLVIAAAAGFLLSWIASAVILLLALGTAAYIEMTIQKLNREDRMFFWQVHSNPKELFKNSPDVPVMDDKLLEPIIDAWYLDIDRLERMAMAGKWEEALKGARELSAVYRNARLSRLMYSALLGTGNETRELYELDEICANLTVEDIPDNGILSFIKLTGRALREGSCSSYDNIKRIFTPMVRRCCDSIAASRSDAELLDALGEDRFRNCGGRIIRESDRTYGALPMSEDAKKLFFTRLSRVVRANRGELIDSGMWYSVLKELRDKYSEEAGECFGEIERCFFNREEHLERDNYYDRAEKADRYDHPAWVFHPEQERFLAGIFERWVVDENGVPYSESSDPLIADLLSDSGDTKRAGVIVSKNVPGDAEESKLKKDVSGIRKERSDDAESKIRTDFFKLPEEPVLSGSSSSSAGNNGPSELSNEFEFPDMVLFPESTKPDLDAENDTSLSDTNSKLLGVLEAILRSKEEQ